MATAKLNLIKIGRRIAIVLVIALIVGPFQTEAKAATDTLITPNANVSMPLETDYAFPDWDGVGIINGYSVTWQIFGVVEKSQYIHPGNGSMIESYLLHFDSPMDFRIAVDDHPGHDINTSDVNSVGIAFEQREQLQDYTGKRVLIRGKFWVGNTAYHTPFMIDADEIELYDSH